MTHLRHVLAVTAALAASSLLVSACATEDYVNQQVGAVKAQVDTVNAKADQNAGSIQALNGAVQDANNKAQQASARIEEHASAQGFAHQVISTDDSTNFATARWALSSEDQSSLSAFAQKLISENQDVYVEIAGHGDARGSKAYNLALGMKRAEATRQYLANQGVPLHRMSVISYGEAMPAATNDTAAGQAENRRVVIQVVAH
jgi:outer membrane protein OmpA-like peptidoglycan-associated protein